MIKVFISYASEDISFARRLVRHLNKFEGIEPWFDEVRLLPGMKWQDEIIKAINASTYVIILLSNSSINKKGFVQKEISEILERLSYFPPEKVFAIPARVEECSPKHRVLTTIQWVDLFINWEDGVDNILKAMGIMNPIRKTVKDERKILEIEYKRLIKSIEENVNITLGEELEVKNLLYSILPILHMDEKGIMLDLLRSIIAKSTKYIFSSWNFYHEFEHLMRTNLPKVLSKHYGKNWKENLSIIIEKHQTIKDIKYMKLGDLCYIYKVLTSNLKIIDHPKLSDKALEKVLNGIPAQINFLVHTDGSSQNLVYHFNFFKEVIPVRYYFEKYFMSL